MDLLGQILGGLKKAKKDKMQEEPALMRTLNDDERKKLGIDRWTEIEPQIVHLIRERGLTPSQISQVVSFFQNEHSTKEAIGILICAGMIDDAKKLIQKLVKKGNYSLAVYCYMEVEEYDKAIQICEQQIGNRARANEIRAKKSQPS